ncbi:unnamed protein product [Gongylonema pulchrum]|uniref:TCTP domain-containing protein n=1 Tax=Gongylonema pulchrum TaxID=637853 RepID=A0A183ER49_9BILA|nr:unnamed protein product [Gongylonema pulchrum]
MSLAASKASWNSSDNRFILPAKIDNFYLFYDEDCNEQAMIESHWEVVRVLTHGPGVTDPLEEVRMIPFSGDVPKHVDDAALNTENKVRTFFTELCEDAEKKGIAFAERTLKQVSAENLEKEIKTTREAVGETALNFYMYVDNKGNSHGMFFCFNVSGSFTFNHYFFIRVLCLFIVLNYNVAQ